MRRNNFGVARLMFAALVIFSHSPEMIDGNRDRELLTRIFGTISLGEFAVDGFFLISGFLIVDSWQKSRTASDYLLRRVLRIYPGFVVAFLMSLLVVGPLSGGDLATLRGIPGMAQFESMLLLHPPSLQHAFAGLDIPMLNGSMWTIAYEFRCYLLTMALGALGIIRHRRIFLALTLLLLAVLVAVPNPSIDLPQPVITIIGWPPDDLRFVTIFCCGGLFHLYRDKIRYSGAWTFACLVGMAGALCVPRVAEPCVAILGGYALFWFIFRIRAGFLNHIGGRVDISYGLYLYAWPVQNLIIWWYPDISPGLLSVVSTMAAAALGTASWFLIEHPSMAWKRRLGSRQTVPAPAAYRSADAPPGSRSPRG